MIITFHTQYFFKLQAGDTVIAIDPLAQKKGTKTSKFGSDMAIATHYDADEDIFDSASYGDKEPVTIYGPGSYEVEGIAIEGFDSMDADGEHHTVYTFEFDDIRVGLLGAQDDKSKLSVSALEALALADVIFAPGTESGHELAQSFSPHIIVATGYNEPKDIAEFTKTLSSENSETVDKLTIKKRDLSELQSKTYVFKA